MAASATHLSVLLMVLALISIHGRLAFPEGKEEFNRDDYGMPPLGTELIDDAGRAIIAAWINGE